MNENRKIELERFLDGELPSDELERVERELVADTEGARYVEQLRRLRQLAVSDGGARVSLRPVVVSLPRIDSRRNRLVAVASGLAAAAAGIVALVWWSNNHADSTHKPRLGKPSVVSNEPPRPKTADAEPVPSSAARLALDAQRHVWVDGEMPSPAVAARRVLDQAAEPVRPTPAEAEILALELANSTAVKAEDIARAVTERTNVLRHPPARNRANRRPAGSPPSSQRDRPGEVSIAELTDFLLWHVG